MIEKILNVCLWVFVIVTGSLVFMACLDELSR